MAVEATLAVREEAEEVRERKQVNLKLKPTARKKFRLRLEKRLFDTVKGVPIAVDLAETLSGDVLLVTGHRLDLYMTH